MKNMLITFLFLLNVQCAYGNQALDIARAGHDQIQVLADLTQEFCQAERALQEREGHDAAALRQYCEKVWDVFKTYKQATDKILTED